MKRIGLKTTKISSALAIALLAVLAMAQPVRSIAQQGRRRGCLAFTATSTIRSARRSPKARSD